MSGYIFPIRLEVSMIFVYTYFADVIFFWILCYLGCMIVFNFFLLNTLSRLVCVFNSSF